MVTEAPLRSGAWRETERARAETHTHKGPQRMKAFALSSKAAVRGGARVGVSSPARAPVAGRRVPGALEVSCKAKQGQELNGRWCRITGKTANNGYSVSHSHIRTKKLQGVNLHVKKIYWPRGERWVKLRVSTKGMKTVQKKGIEAAAKDAGIDLWKLPFVLDESEARKQWKKQQREDGNVQLHGRTLPKDRRKMVNLEKLAKSDHPLAAECSALLGKLSLTGDRKKDAELLNLRKLAASDHELASEAKGVLDRSAQLGPILSEKHRQKKYQEAHGY